MAAISQLKVCVGTEVISVDQVKDGTRVQEYIQDKCMASGREEVEDPFMVVDVGRLFGLHDEWKMTLPGICPFYAVKCNDDLLLLKTMAAMGLGFDCTSKAEIARVLDLGVSPNRIIYANPCKQISHLKYAAQKGVELMTFDNKSELEKVEAHYPTAKLVIRIRADDPNAICQLGIKYGCSVAVGKELLSTAMSLGLQVVGVSFHVGSGCQTPLAFESALKLSSEMFQFASSIGYSFTLLDIGGGYPGDKGSGQLFNKVASSINKGIEAYFSRKEFPNLRIIAEPGRYFACSTHAAAVNVVSKRLQEEEGEEPSYMYYVTDGVYGSFNIVLYDHVVPVPAILKDSSCSAPLYRSSLWGPTCDGLDKICETVMPEMEIGDWIYFDNMGAYTLSACSPFNGFAKPVSYYYLTETDRAQFESLLGTEQGEIDLIVTKQQACAKVKDYLVPAEHFRDSLLYYYSVL